MTDTAFEGFRDWVGRRREEHDTITDWPARAMHATLDRDTGAPLPLFPGMPRPHENFYYPSAAMHALAADALEPVVRSLLGG